MRDISGTVSAVRAGWLAHVSAKTVYAWIRAGKLPATKRFEAGKPATYEVRLDDLAQLPGVEIDADRLAQMSQPYAQQAEARIMERMRQIESRMDAYEAGQAYIQGQIAALARAQLPPPDMPAGTYATSPSDTGDTLPEGYISVYRWARLHGIPRGTVLAAIASGRVPRPHEGSWTYRGSAVKTAWDAQQAAAAVRYWEGLGRTLLKPEGED